MSYASIRTAHDVGDTVYFYDETTDSARRVVVASIEAQCLAPPLLDGRWSLTYTVREFSGARCSECMQESELHRNAGDAFPSKPAPVVVEPEAVPA